MFAAKSNSRLPVACREPGAGRANPKIFEVRINSIENCLIQSGTKIIFKNAYRFVPASYTPRKASRAQLLQCRSDGNAPRAMLPCKYCGRRRSVSYLCGYAHGRNWKICRHAAASSAFVPMIHPSFLSPTHSLSETERRGSVRHYPDGEMRKPPFTTVQIASFFASFFWAAGFFWAVKSAEMRRETGRRGLRAVPSNDATS